MRVCKKDKTKAIIKKIIYKKREGYRSILKREGYHEQWRNPGAGLRRF